MGVMKKEVTEIQDDLELLRKRTLAKTVIIHGIKEQPNEKYGELDREIKELQQKLELKSLDYDNVRSMGPRVLGRNRPIELTLVRKVDKFAILFTKKKLKDQVSSRSIYINSARTQKEQAKYIKLLEYARSLKALNCDIRFIITAYNVLDVQNGNRNEKFEVNKEGKVTQYQPGSTRLGRPKLQPSGGSQNLNGL